MGWNNLLVSFAHSNGCDWQFYPEYTNYKLIKWSMINEATRTTSWLVFKINSNKCRNSLQNWDSFPSPYSQQLALLSSCHQCVELSSLVTWLHKMHLQFGLSSCHLVLDHSGNGASIQVNKIAQKTSPVANLWAVKKNINSRCHE